MDLEDGQTYEMQGSGSKPYQIKNVGAAYSCSCPAWRNQSLPPNARTCKHIRKLRGDAAEEARLQMVGTLAPSKPEGSEEVEKLPVLRAQVWDEEQDISGWWMSEKLDGVRAYWDGKQLLSRGNNIFHAPSWFLEGLPNYPLDGELWISRKQFNKTSGIVRKQGRPEEWKEIRYLIFDAPDAAGPFEERMKFLAEVVRGWKSNFVGVHEHALCRDNSHASAELARVLGLGGEGLMVRQPGSLYVRSESSTLLKIKKFLDAEAIVLGYEAGKGKHKGRVGALRARFSSGVEFEVGTGMKDKDRENPPAVGSIILVKYAELDEKSGKPRFPVYVGVRPDGDPTQPPPTRKKKAEAGFSVPAPVSSGSPAAGNAKRYFEFLDGASNKFWEIWMDGTDVTTQWGKVGAGGQTKTKAFADEAKARKEYDKLVAEKTEKGYVEKPRPA